MDKQLQDIDIFANGYRLQYPYKPVCYYLPIHLYL